MSYPATSVGYAMNAGNGAIWFCDMAVLLRRPFIIPANLRNDSHLFGRFRTMFCGWHFL
jgi:hypothetical protein